MDRQTDTRVTAKQYAPTIFRSGSIKKAIPIEMLKDTRTLYYGSLFATPLSFHNIICLTNYHTMPHFDALKIYSCRKHCEKRKTACNKQFLLFSQCFLPMWYLFSVLKCSLKCRLQFVSIWTSLKFYRLVMGKLKNVMMLLVR